jgi:hypothetical protein
MDVCAGEAPTNGKRLKSAGKVAEQSEIGKVGCLTNFLARSTAG